MTSRDGASLEETATSVTSITGLVAAQLAVSAVTQAAVMLDLGPTLATDIWIAASAVPVALGAVGAVVVQGVWQWRLAVHDAPERHRIMGEALGQLTVWAIPVTLLGWLMVRPWFRWWFHWSAAELGLGLTIFRIGLVTAVLGAVVQLQSFFWRGQGAHQRVEQAMLISAAAGGICTLLLLRASGVMAPVIGGVMQVGLAIGLLWPPRGVIRSLRWRAPARAHRREGLLLVASAVATRATIVVDRLIMTGAPAGALTVFTFANGVASQFAAMGGRVIAFPAVGPYLRARSSGEEHAGAAVRRRVVRAIVPLVAGGALLALGAAGVVRGFGLSAWRIGADDLTRLLTLVGILVLTIIPATVGALSTARLQAAGLQGRLLAIGVVGLIASLAAKFVAYHRFGVVGLAGAVVFHYALNGAAVLLAERAIATART